MSNILIRSYANDDHFATVLEQYGGENFLQENYPHILQMLYNTREMHQSIEKNEEELTGYHDTFNIEPCQITDVKKRQTNQSISNQYGVYEKSYMTLTNAASFLQISSKVYDPKNNKVFASTAVYNTNCHKLDNDLQVDHSLLSYSVNKDIQITSNFFAAAKVNGKSICVADPTPVSRVIHLDDFNPIVKEITVNDPKPKNTGDSRIRIVYNGRKDSNAAYNFPKAAYKTINKVRYVQTFYPFNITVKLDDNFLFNEKEPVKFDSTFFLTLASQVVQGGEVHYSTTYLQKITAKASGNTLTLSFPYSKDTNYNFWGVEMPLTAKQADGDFDFHLNFTINFHAKNNIKDDIQTTIIVTSESLPLSQNMVRIVPSKILWGCLGKDTVVRTEDGYKKISKINVGDKIFTNKGYIKLKNMVTGTEARIIAVGVSDEDTLLITNKHPITTDRGVICAEDISVGDKLMMEDGTFKTIAYFEVKDYNDKVYSPELEESALISANGIMVGDYLTAVDTVDEPCQEPEPLEPELLEELIRWTEYKNEQLQKEINV